MGRKGMKGFLKGADKRHNSDDETHSTVEGATEQPGTKPAAGPEQQDVSKAPQQAKPSEKPSGHARESGDDEDSDDEEDGGSKGPEKRGKLLQRHKREMAAHKKAVQKLGSKKKDEAAKLTAEIEARHARELAELEEREKQQTAAAAAAAGTSGACAVDAEDAAQGMAGLGVGASAAAAAEHKKPSKAQKRREKLAQQDAEREQRIAAEYAALGPSDKAVEEEQLQALLLPLRLGIREIRADGHCLYRAVEDQITQAGPGALGPGGAALDYLALRRLAASHIRAHPDDFLPFLYDEDAAGSPEEQLESYCQELEGTAVWGGQLELGALAQALKKQIKVYALGMPTLTLGDEHASDGVLQVCYLRHAFGLGEHYNSVAPLKAADDADG